MNEQLFVKNFGPIKDATVDFKRVTVFIGPTGGGKSTLAKLAAVFRDATLYSSGQQGLKSYLSNYAIKSFESESTTLYWHSKLMSARLLDGKLATRATETVAQEMVAMRQQLEAAAIELKALSELLDVSPPSIGKEEATGKITELFRLKKEATEFYKRTIAPNRPHYIPAERLLLSALGTSWPDLIRESANLPIVLLDFAKQYGVPAASDAARLVTDAGSHLVDNPMHLVFERVELARYVRVGFALWLGKPDVVVRT